MQLLPGAAVSCDAALEHAPQARLETSNGPRLMFGVWTTGSSSDTGWALSFPPFVVFAFC